jgi:hypothetical protein
MPFRRRCRYVARVASERWASGMGSGVVIAMTDPDTAAEAAARTGHDESS